MALGPAYVAISALASPPLMLLVYNTLNTSKPSSHVATNKVVRIPDPSIFHADSIKDTISYGDWHLQMKNTLQANRAHMPTKTTKKFYVQSCIADNALVQLSMRFEKEATRPFLTVKKMFNMLTAAFSDTNWKRNARIEYRLLWQRTQDFNTC